MTDLTFVPESRSAHPPVAPVDATRTARAARAPDEPPHEAFPVEWVLFPEEPHEPLPLGASAPDVGAH